MPISRAAQAVLPWKTEVLKNGLKFAMVRLSRSGATPHTSDFKGLPSSNVHAIYHPFVDSCSEKTPMSKSRRSYTPILRHSHAAEHAVL